MKFLKLLLFFLMTTITPMFCMLEEMPTEPDAINNFLNKTMLNIKTQEDIDNFETLIFKFLNNQYSVNVLTEETIINILWAAKDYGLDNLQKELLGRSRFRNALTPKCPCLIL